MGKLILDTNRSAMGHFDALKAAGYGTVIRYIAAGLVGEEKVIKPTEARAIAAAGLRLGVVYETNGRPRGSSVGQRDGEFCRDYLPTIGAPKGACIWYTVDFDAQQSDLPGIRAAFVAFKAALGPDYRVGGYASGYICDELYADGLIDARWLTDSGGFKGTKASLAAGRYEMKQALPRQVAGLDTDPDAVHVAADGTAADIGDFVPFASPDARPAPPTVPAPASAAPNPAPALRPMPVPHPPRADREHVDTPPPAQDRQAGGES